MVVCFGVGQCSLAAPERVGVLDVDVGDRQRRIGSGGAQMTSNLQQHNVYKSEKVRKVVAGVAVGATG